MVCVLGRPVVGAAGARGARGPPLDPESGALLGRAPADPLERRREGHPGKSLPLQLLIRLSHRESAVLFSLVNVS